MRPRLHSGDDGWPSECSARPLVLYRARTPEHTSNGDLRVSDEGMEQNAGVSGGSVPFSPTTICWVLPFRHIPNSLVKLQFQLAMRSGGWRMRACLGANPSFIGWQNWSECGFVSFFQARYHLFSVAYSGKPKENR